MDTGVLMAGVLDMGRKMAVLIDSNMGNENKKQCAGKLFSYLYLGGGGRQ